MQPDSLGHWGKYGGRFVPETLMAPLEELTGAYLLSQEGQQIVADTVHTWSARKDVKAPKGKPELDSIKTVSFDWTKASTEKGQLLDLCFQNFQGQ